MVFKTHFTVNKVINHHSWLVANNNYLFLSTSALSNFVSFIPLYTQAGQPLHCALIMHEQARQLFCTLTNAYVCVHMCVYEVDKEEAQDKWQTKTALMRWVKKQRKWILNIFVLIIIVLVAQQRWGQNL